MLEKQRRIRRLLQQRPSLRSANLLLFSRTNSWNWVAHVSEKSYRTKPTIQLLWRGIGAYIQLFQVSLLFGCGSFPGTDTEFYKQALSYLYHFHLAPPELRAKHSSFLSGNEF